MDTRKLTIGQHLDELRSSVIRALLWVLLAFVVAFFFQQDLMGIVVQPHVEAIGAISSRQRERTLDDHFGDLGPQVALIFEQLSSSRQRLEKAESGLRASAPDALEPLRRKVVRAQQLADSTSAAAARFDQTLQRFHGQPDSLMADLILALDTWQRSLQQLEASLQDGLLDRLPPGSQDLKIDSKLKILRYPESFIAHFKVALILALFFASPLAGRELWRFVGAGLFPNESRYVVVFAPVSFLLFLLGVLFGYYVLIPLGLSYMATYGDPAYLELGITLSDYLSLFMILTIFLGLVFELPLVLLFLGKIGMVTPPVLRKGRRYLILIAFIAAAILTPPDPITQVLMAIPIILLYEIGIVLVAVFCKPEAAPLASAQEPAS